MPPRGTNNSRSAGIAEGTAQPEGAPQHSPTPERSGFEEVENLDPELEDADADAEPRDTPFDDQSTPNLAQAIMLMTKELRRRENISVSVPRAKAKEPDTFDGSEPRKLNNFILLCNLYFRTNPAYSADETKVTFALSYLRGTALEYFEPSILDSDEVPDWMDNWSAFVRTLRTQFGPIDPTADAEDGIDNLRMQDNQHIVKYNVEFNRLSIRTGWDDSVLRHRYYTGLAERIKDIMGQQGKPGTLEGMKTLAHSIDARHWERAREKSRSKKPDSDKSDKSDEKKDSASNNSKKNNKSDNKSGKQPSSSGNSAALSEKLGKDGKLTSQERQRRFDNHLCMFCGGVGHSAKECPKSTSSASKAKVRAVQAKETESTSDSKKD